MGPGWRFETELSGSDWHHFRPVFSELISGEILKLQSHRKKTFPICHNHLSEALSENDSEVFYANKIKELT